MLELFGGGIEVAHHQHLVAQRVPRVTASGVLFAHGRQLLRLAAHQELRLQVPHHLEHHRSLRHSSGGMLFDIA
jgi:hypothetical protein